MSLPFQRTPSTTGEQVNFDEVSDFELDAMISQKCAEKSPDAHTLLSERARRRLKAGTRVSHGALFKR